MNNTILIVDDMKMNIDLLAQSLDDRYIIIPATSGESAVKLLNRVKPDLVLLDVFMPEMDGFALLRYMKSQASLANIPVIFITGESDDNTEKEGLALGAVDYIKKPINALIVREKVQNHLALKAYRDSLEESVRERTKELEEKTRQLSASREAIIMGMSLMSDRHDGVTGGHIERIKKYTAILAQAVASEYPDLATRDMAHQIELFSPLHDVGKIGISDIILKKTGILTPDEYLIMQSHTLEGAALLKKTESFLTDGMEGNNLKIAMEIAEYHHERYDGTGYPHGLIGEEIPISARIVSVADVYDAVRSPRPYKQAFTHEETVRMIATESDERTSSRHFDPKVVNAFLRTKDEFEKVNR